MSENLSTETTSSDSLSPAEQAYFSSRGEDTSGLDAQASQDGAGSPPASGQADAPTNGQSPASGQETAGNEPASDDDGEEVIIVGKDGKPRAQGSGRFVPHQALHKEREQRKALASELATERQRYARADERLSVLNEILSKADEPARAPTSAQSEATIDPEKDPIGALNQLMRRNAELEKREKDREAREQERANSHTLKTTFEKDAVAYMKDQPDFLDAYKFMLKQRGAELAAWGYEQSVITEMVAEDERNTIANAFRAKKSPSQIIYNMAVARGYTKVAPTTQPKAGQPGPMDKIDQLAKAQQAAGAGLSGAGGSPGEGLTMATIADMSEDELVALTAKVGKAKMRQLLGG